MFCAYIWFHIHWWIICKHIIPYPLMNDTHYMILTYSCLPWGQIFSTTSPFCLAIVISDWVNNRTHVFCRMWLLVFILIEWRATHICVGKLTIIGSDNGLPPGRRQASIWTIAGILLIGTLGTNFSEISFGIQAFSFKKMQLKMSSAKWRPFVSASIC